jgi:flavin reductase (DIM6/NTAB) family NADH-FMN oxidoreductase RutF
MDYLEIIPENAYELMNTGGIIWVCTKGPDGRYNITPIAWSCPLEFEPVSQVLFVCSRTHTCFINLSKKKEYVIALPSFTQKDLVEKTGSISGANTEKYLKFSIDSFPARKVDALIPTGVAGWLECRLIQTIAEGAVSIVLGEVITAFAKPDGWKERLHHASGGYYRPAPL